LKATNTTLLHHVSKKVLPSACYKLDTHEWILIFFGRNVTDKVGNDKMLYYVTQVTCASSLPGKMGKCENHIFTQLDCVKHTMHLCAFFLKEIVVICDVFDSV